MKHFIDGDMVVVTRDDFVNLQESPAVFIPAGTPLGRAVVNDGVLAMPIGALRRVRYLLNNTGGGELLGYEYVGLGW